MIIGHNSNINREKELAPKAHCTLSPETLPKLVNGATVLLSTNNNAYSNVPVMCMSIITNQVLHGPL